MHYKHKGPIEICCSVKYPFMEVVLLEWKMMKLLLANHHHPGYLHKRAAPIAIVCSATKSERLLWRLLGICHHLQRTFAPAANKSRMTKIPRDSQSHTSNLGALALLCARERERGAIRLRQTLTGTLDNNRALLWPPFMEGQFFICVMHNLMLVRGCEQRGEPACVITHCPRSKSMCVKER
jgi:hypothetical protein